ncbi:unnamed protein product [Polarella glacialis]|uniref:nicotinamidase n=1 Tax=Polarella glacialis TaxID=89957 RepID=A0A813F8V5_POLGL|nr:unnamed protein product [Polarella glacialis]
MALDADNLTARWRMRSEGFPYFTEYLGLAQAAGWDDLIDPGDMDVHSTDALVIVDMQNDFVPVDALNPKGGAFAVPEGNGIAPLIVELAEYFASKGAVVAACRDYHPDDHCSFIPNGGDFPQHCVQGSIGSHFYKPIGTCVQNLRQQGHRVEVVFKGFHEDVDSFGCFEYPNAEPSFQRLSYRGDNCCERPNLHGCSLSAWTGACILRRSNQKADVNAPPDVLSAHRRETLGSWFKREGVRRVFACGLAADFCVLDTVLNAKAEGFQEAYLLMDAGRAAYLPGLGEVGSGFVQDPVKLKEMMVEKNIRLIPAAAVLPAATQAKLAAPAVNGKTGKHFPQQLGPFALLSATSALVLSLDFAAGQWTASGAAADELLSRGFEARGSFAPPFKMTIDAPTRENLKLSEEAVFCAWCNPSENTGNLNGRAEAYLSTVSSSAAFLVNGGFVYLNKDQELVDVRGVSIGSGLSYGAPSRWKADFSTALVGRWHPVTLPYLLKTGAKLFAWINPGEVLAPQGGGEPWKVCDHGAFAYLFHASLSEQDDRDLFFELEALHACDMPRKCTLPVPE